MTIKRLPMGRRRGRASLRTRFSGYARYLIRVTIEGFRVRPDCILCFHNPPALPIVGLFMARVRNIPFVYVPADIHPDILVATGFIKLPRLVVLIWDVVHRLVLQRSDAIVALGSGMAHTLIEDKGAKPETVHVIPPWAEPEFDKLSRDDKRRGELGVDADTMLVLYAGNMGLMHPLANVFSAAAMLSDESIEFRFAGAGVRRPVWEQLSGSSTNTAMLPFQHGDHFRSLVAASDVFLVSLAPGMQRLAVPSRTFTVMSAGRPIIALMDYDSDIANLVRESCSGWHVETEEDLVELLRYLAKHPSDVIARGENARRVSLERFRQADVTLRYVTLIEECLSAGLTNGAQGCRS